MAGSQTVKGQIPDESRSGADAPGDHLRRAAPPDALDLAQAMVLEGGRVDMGALAARLGISRATLYRWFGSREQLLEQLLERQTVAFIESARAGARGEGDERVLDVARRFMSETVHFKPARTFVAREPQLALRLLLGEDGAVHRALTKALREEVAGTRPPEEARALESRVEIMVQVATALQWAPFAIGDEPQIERAVQIMRMMLAAGHEAAAQ